MFAAVRLSTLRPATLALSRTNTFQQPGSLRRLLSSLALLEAKDGKLNVSSVAAVTAAMKLSGSVIGLLAGSGTKAVADEAAKIKGLDKVLYVDSSAYDRVGRFSRLLS